MLTQAERDQLQDLAGFVCWAIVHNEPLETTLCRLQMDISTILLKERGIAPKFQDMAGWLETWARQNIPGYGRELSEPGDRFDLSLISLFCQQHGRRTWHVLGIDGVCRCLDCRLEEYETTQDPGVSEATQ